MAFSVRQSGTVTAQPNAAVTLASQPVEGNLLVALASDRSGATDYTVVSGTGWTKTALGVYEQTSSTYRRSSVVFWKFAASGESQTLSVTSGVSDSYLTLLEVQSDSGTPASLLTFFDLTHASDRSNTIAQSSGSTPSSSTGDVLLVGLNAIKTDRTGTGWETWTNGLSNVYTYDNAGSSAMDHSAALGETGAAGTKETTASGDQVSTRGAITTLLVFQKSSGGGGVDQDVMGSSGIPSAGAFGTGTVTASAAQVTGASGIASASAFGTGAVTPAPVDVTGATGLPTAEAFGTGTVTGIEPGSVQGEAGLASVEAFGTGTLTPAAVDLTGSTGIPTGEAFGSGTVVPDAVALAGTAGIPSAEALGTGDVGGAAASVSGTTGITSAEAFGSGVLTPSAADVTGDTGLASQEAFGTGAVTGQQPGTITGGVGIASAEAFGSGTVTPFAVSLTGTTGILSAEVFGTGVVSGDAERSIAGSVGIPSAATFGAGGLVEPTPAQLSGMAGIASLEALGVGTVVRVEPQDVEGTAGIGSALAFGTGAVFLIPLDAGWPVLRPQVRAESRTATVRVPDYAATVRRE